MGMIKSRYKDPYKPVSISCNVSQGFWTLLTWVVSHSFQEKKRNFLETVELQIGLKDYDTQRDKRFVLRQAICLAKLKVKLLGRIVRLAPSSFLMFLVPD